MSNSTVGLLAIGLGAIGLALGINDRITRSLVLRKYLVEQYMEGDWFGHAQLVRIPIGMMFFAGGAAAIEAQWSSTVEIACITLSVVSGAVTVFALLHVPAFLKPGWFKAEEAAGFPLSAQEPPPEKKPAIVRICSAAVIALVGLMFMFGHSLPVGIVLIAVGVGVGYGPRLLRWPRRRGPSD